MRIQVRSGDSLWYYSQLFMVPVNLLVDSNPNVNPTALQIGQDVQIPGFDVQSYTIKQGDTLWKLATARNITVDVLLLVNPQVNPQALMIGTNILLPTRIITPLMDRKRSYSYQTLLSDIKGLQNIYSFIRVNEIGQSVLGVPIYELRIGKGDRKVHMNASFHANEWITSSILMALVNSYLLSLTNERPLRGLATMPFYNETELSIVPMVNPDGVDLVLGGPPSEVSEQVLAINNGSDEFSGWKANIRGVDLNNQYPANWEVEQARKPVVPSPRDYPGEQPLTEPEAIAMAELASDNQFDRLLAFHTQGEEFYWGYEGLEPPESAVIAEEFARVSGYRSVQYVDSYAGYKDWFIQEFRKPGFTMELGKGVNPLPLSQFEDIYEEMLGVFLASLYM
ncbi:M14 family metallopeptidase [Cytobacillus purgationiresistens]|uniref:G-D-glutamyl-meso-diaminopimelate peptidase n=1 Tax=Cytobacillus purgationiresistens TaxID=863449 RepID=A0ABU0AF84_9BACI|nr:M14 family metallopeptidase [Cytobacillus purgationiresistens]MDQ0269437.1 g-D-glutamyl-meso-diaminopimelate peptidase [Cytobacillus purgationiresistens]